MSKFNLVNGYVLSDLFYELMFLDEHGITVEACDWSSQLAVDDVVTRLVLPRFHTYTIETQQVIRNTLRYLLFSSADVENTMDMIWEVSSSPIPTPGGVRKFFARCYELIFAGEPDPTAEELDNYLVHHDMHMANTMN